MSSYERKKLNIAFVCDAVTDCVAGSFVSTLRFAELLSTRGHKVIFITSRSPKSPSDNYYKNIKAYRFPGILLPKSEGQLRIGFSTIKRIRDILQDEDINIVHTMIPTPLSLVSTKAANQLEIKVVAHSHTQPENLFLHMPKGPWLNFLNNIFYRYMSWLYGKSDALIYPSQFAKNRMTGIKTNVQTLIISNGVNTEHFKKIPVEKLFEKFSLPREATHLLYAGRLHPEKSLETLINAMPLIIKHHPNTHLSLAGFGHLDTKLMQQAKVLGVEKHITFMGRVSDEEMVMAMNVCDIFVFPSLAELEGMVVLEAMSCGKPIIVANAPESASIYFVKDNGFLFEQKNPEDLAQQVGKLIINPELRVSMGEQSLLMSKHYDINESVRKLEELYYTLLGK